MRGAAASTNPAAPANIIQIGNSVNQSSPFGGAIANTQNDDVLNEAAEVDRLLNSDSYVFLCLLCF